MKESRSRTAPHFDRLRVSTVNFHWTGFGPRDGPPIAILCFTQ